MHFPKHVALIFPRDYDYNIHEAVVEYAGKHFWHLSVIPAHWRAFSQDWKGDGIILGYGATREIFQRIRAIDVPVVSLSLVAGARKPPTVCGDHAAIGRQAAEHLLRQGLRNFAWFSGLDVPATWERAKAFRKTLKAEGFDCFELMWREAAPGGIEPWFEISSWLQREIARLPKPVGIFAFNDLQAVSVLDACLAAGIHVPEQVAIVGCDNNRLLCESAAVHLSSVRHDNRQLGAKAAELLDSLMAGNSAPAGPLLLQPQGVEARRSTATVAVEDPLTRNALRYLKENFSRNIHVEDILRALKVSRSQLEGAFRRSLGRSVHHELTHLRLQHAMELLRGTRLDIATVSKTCGFARPEYFHRFFSRLTGTTPRQFRLSQEAPRIARASRNGKTTR